MMLNGIALCQGYTLPSVLFDSMTFEVFKGRSCDSVRIAQADEIIKKGKELIDTNKALELSQSESKTLSSLLQNSKESNEILSVQFSKDLKEEKRKTKKWRGIAVIESVGFIGILILML